MQLSWLWRGLRTGILTTKYPRATESMPDNWRGVVVLDASRCRDEAAVPLCVRACLPAALTVQRQAGGERELTLDPLACIACGRCVDACPSGALSMSSAFELAQRHHDEGLRE